MYNQGDKLEIIGKVDTLNIGNTFKNVSVLNEEKKVVNVKLDNIEFKSLEIGKLYVFYVSVDSRADGELILQATSYKRIEDVLETEKIHQLYEFFYTYAPIPLKTIKAEIEAYLDRIQAQPLKTLTNYLYQKFKDKFYTHPAATKFHHAYVGGLSYHTLTMLKLADGFYPVYPYLDQDMVIAGIILHDMSKIHEMTGVDGEYTLEGLMIGHLVMQTIEIDKAYQDLKLDDEDMLIVLKHIILSHHGLPHFGAAKKPMTAEALLIWYIDTIDSKFTVLGEELDKVNKGEFTSYISVLEKQKFYKKK
jgi:3'-5' exoribonuclease